MRPAIAPDVRAQIARLSRRAHAFHRFAHHPLCDRYGEELLGLGSRTRICRGCTFSLLGGTLGAAAGALLVPPLQILAICAALALGMAAVSLIPTAPGRARIGKLWTRGLPAFSLALGLGAALTQHDPPHLLLAAVSCSALGGLFLAYRRRGPERSPCQACPERTSSAPCSGFRAIVRAERAFSRRSAQLIAADNLTRLSHSVTHPATHPVTHPKRTA